MATASASSTISLLSTRSSATPRASPIPAPSFPRFFSSFAPSNPISLSLSPTSPHSISPKRSSSSSSSSTFSVSAEKKNVLIVNTNSGGHAVIGFCFAQELLSSGHDVTVLTVGEEGSDKMKKPPFTRFSELTSAGGKTVWGDPAEVAKAVGGAAFDVVLDNNGKDLDTVKPVADWAKSAGVGQFLYISSAGIYKTSDEVPHVEGDPVKGDASHVSVEKYIAELSFSSWAVFRPQYMTGSGNNKDCEEWFFDRTYPACYLAVANPAAASGNIFNCVSDRAVSFNGLVKLCSQAAGIEAKVVYYDPKAVGVDAKKAFPFRNMHFYAEPRAAKERLGWSSSTNLAEDLKERFKEYISIGRDKKQIKFDIDDKILEALKVPVAV